MDIITLALNAIRNLFFGEEKLSHKAAYLALLIGCTVVLVLVLESAMGLITIGRLERQINLLKELNALADTGLGTHDNLVKLDSLFSNYVNGLEQYTPADLSLFIHAGVSANLEILGNILPGAVPWLFLAAIAPFAMKEPRALKIAVIVATIVCATFVGFLAALAFQFPNPGISTFVRFVAGCLSIWAIIRWQNRRSQRVNSQGNTAADSEAIQVGG